METFQRLYEDLRAFRAREIAQGAWEPSVIPKAVAEV